MIMKTKTLGLFGILGIYFLFLYPTNVQAAELTEYPTCYENGDTSPVTIRYNETGTAIIYGNGTSLIFSDNKMYEDVAPYGEFDNNDKRIFTEPKIDGNADFAGNEDMALTYVYLETGGTDDTFYGDNYITITNTTLRGIAVNHVNNATVSILGSDVLRNYIEYTTGDVSYSVESTAMQDIILMDTSCGEENNPGLIDGNLDISLNNINNSTAYIRAGATVSGNTTITVNNSTIDNIGAACKTGTVTSNANVSVNIDNSTINYVTGFGVIEGGYVNGDTNVTVSNSNIELGIQAFANDVNVGDNKNTVNGVANITVTDSNIGNIIDVNSNSEDASLSDRAYTRITNSSVKKVLTNEAALYGNVIGSVYANKLSFNDNACLIGDFRINDQISGIGSLKLDVSTQSKTCYFEGDSPISEGSMVTIIPVKSNGNGYDVYGETEYLPHKASIQFLNDNLNSPIYKKYFTSENYEFQEKVNGNYSEIFILNYCPNHTWEKASTSGNSGIEKYADDDCAATCTTTGIETYYCTICEKYEHRTTPKLGHNYLIDKTIAPTTSEKGYTIYKCSGCGDTYQSDFKDKIITTTSVSELSYTYSISVGYTGKALKPTVTIKDGNTILKQNTDYTISYKNNKKIGTATITIKGNGNYNGTKTLNFDIVPKKATISSVKSLKVKTATVKWKKNTTATGYMIQYSTDKNFKENVKTVKISKNKTTSTTLKKLKAKKTYYVRVALYKKVDGKTYTGAYSKSIKVKIK